MSFTHNHDNFEATEPLGIPRFLDDFEDNGSLEGPMTEPDVLRFVRRVGLSDPHGHMPVSLSHLITVLLSLVDRCHPRCRG